MGFALLVALSALGCRVPGPAAVSDPAPPTPASASSATGPVELLTGDTGCYAGGEQGMAGILVVDPEFGTRFNGKPVLWPTGFTGVRVGGEVEVRDPAGRRIATTGQPYYISYAYVDPASEADLGQRKIEAYPAAATCGYEWDFIDCTTTASPYCDVILPPPTPTPEPIVLDAAHAGPVLCAALTALADAEQRHVAPLAKVFRDKVPPGDEPPLAWSAEESAAAKAHGVAVSAALDVHGQRIANIQSPDLEALVAATKASYDLYGQGMAYLQPYLDGIPGTDVTGLSGPLATLQDGGTALGEALTLMREADAAGTVDCAVPAP